MNSSQSPSKPSDGSQIQGYTMQPMGGGPQFPVIFPKQLAPNGSQGPQFSGFFQQPQQLQKPHPFQNFAMMEPSFSSNFNQNTNALSAECSLNDAKHNLGSNSNNNNNQQQQPITLVPMKTGYGPIPGPGYMNPTFVGSLVPLGPGPVGQPIVAGGGHIPLQFNPGAATVSGPLMPFGPNTGFPVAAGFNSVEPANRPTFQQLPLPPRMIPSKEVGSVPTYPRYKYMGYGAWNNTKDVFSKNQPQPHLLLLQPPQQQQHQPQRTVQTQRRRFVGVTMANRFCAKQWWTKEKTLTAHVAIQQSAPPGAKQYSCITECRICLKRALGVGAGGEDCEKRYQRVVDSCAKAAKLITNNGRREALALGKDCTLALTLYSFDWLYWDEIKQYPPDSPTPDFDREPLNVFCGLNRCLASRTSGSKRNGGDDDDGALGVLRYLDDGVTKLRPFAARLDVYCWCRRNSQLMGSLRVGENVWLEAYQSAASSLDVLKSVLAGVLGECIVFKIETVSGRDISVFSYANVFQVLLLPGTGYEVVSSADSGDGYTLVSLREFTC